LKIFHKKESTVAGKLWTEEELGILEEGYPSDITNDDLMEMLPGRSWPGIANKAHGLGLSRPGQKSWTEEERELLREAYCDPERGPLWLAKELDRTVPSITSRASKMGIVLNPQYSEKEMQYLKDNYATKGPAALAKDLGKTKSSITSKAWFLGSVFDRKEHNAREAIETLKGTEYELIEYRPWKSLVKHKPCEHVWEVRIPALVSYVGCPNCSIIGNRKNTKTFYLIFFPELNVYKVGITGNLDTRRSKFGETSEVIDTTVFETAEECRSYESVALKKLEPYKDNTGVLTSGNTETFRWDDSSPDLKNFLTI